MIYTKIEKKLLIYIFCTDVQHISERGKTHRLLWPSEDLQRILFWNAGIGREKERWREREEMTEDIKCVQYNAAYVGHVHGIPRFFVPLHDVWLSARYTSTKATVSYCVFAGK